MSLDLLKENIEHEKTIARELGILVNNLQNEEDNERKKFIIASITHLLSQLKIINKAMPDLLNNISFYKSLSSNEAKKDNNLTNIKIVDNNKQKLNVTINKKDEKGFLKSLFAHRQAKEVIAKNESSKNEDTEYYARISNKLFRNYADRIVQKGYFSNLKRDLRKITSHIVINSFVSMMLFSTVIAFFFAFIIFLILIVLKFYLVALLALILIPLITFIIFYMYPSSERSNYEKTINQELPFLTIYMSAISTSGIEPSKIFQILVASKDYPASQRELKKLNNYINFYGYDIVGALKKTAESCPSEKLAQLFDGLATTITSGGELSNFLSKHADTLLFDYRLEREKYTHVAETFMNIYISVVIAAPMILMMLFVLMSVASLSAGSFNPTTLSFIIIFAISLINVMFIVFLNVKQPKF